MKQVVKGHGALAKILGLKDSVAKNFSESLTKSSGKSSLSEQQHTDINLLFSKQISTNAPVTLVDVKIIMSESLNLISDVNAPVMVRKVFDCVRYLEKKNF